MLIIFQQSTRAVNTYLIGQTELETSIRARTIAPMSSDSESSTAELREDDGWEDAEPDQEEIQVKSLFDDKIFSDVKSMLDYSKENFGFDFLAVRQQLGTHAGI
jgi:hypothetical protein